MSSSDMVRCLEEVDVVGVRRLWARERPHMPQPNDNHQALVMIHYARTQAESIRFKLRAYSHRWLLDHQWPSGLPDDLKPKAERMYPDPNAVGSVGISVGATSEIGRAIAPHVREAMENSVLDSYANNKHSSQFVKQRMLEARSAVIDKLLGRKRGH